MGPVVIGSHLKEKMLPFNRSRKFEGPIAPLEPSGPTALPISKPRNFRVMRAHDMLGLGFIVQRLIARTLFIRFGAMLEISIP